MLCSVAHCVLAGSEKVSFDGDITTALRVDTGRFLRGLTNIAYGLYFHAYGIKCPHPVQVHTPALHGDDKQPRQDVIALVDSLRPLLASVAVGVFRRGGSEELAPAMERDRGGEPCHSSPEPEVDSERGSDSA